MFSEETPRDLAGEAAHAMLVARAQTGDEDALRELLLMHQDSLLQYVRAKLGERLQAFLCPEDVVQEALIHASRDLSKCEAREKSAFAAWLRGIANHRLQDSVKHIMRKKRGGDLHRVEGGASPNASRSNVHVVDALSAQVSSPSRALARDEMGAALRVAVACLQEDQRNAIIMHYVDGMPVAEVAEKLARTPAAVRGLLHRGLEVMRRGLDQSAIWLSTR